MSDNDFSKEERILQMMRKVLTDVAKDTYTKPGLKHPLSENTILSIRECLKLISAREGELAEAAGRPSEKRPRYIDEPDWKINPHFATEVRKLLLGGAIEHGEIHSAPVLLICRSGKRSVEAGELLLREGFMNVYNVDEGFEGELDEKHHRSTLGGWRFHGLPWEQC